MGKGIIENDHKVPLQDLNECMKRHFGSKSQEFRAIVSSFITHWSQIVSFSRFDERYPADGFMPTISKKSWEVHVISPKNGEKYVYSGQAAMHALLPLDERNSAGMHSISKTRRDKKFRKSYFFEIAYTKLYTPLMANNMIEGENELNKFLIQYYDISTGMSSFGTTAWGQYVNRKHKGLI